MEVMGKIDQGVVSIEKDGRIVFTVDLSGRFIFYTDGNATYRRSLENKFLKITHNGNTRKLEQIPDDQAREIANSAYDFLRSSHDSLPEEIREAVSPFLDMNYEKLVLDAEKMKIIYGGDIPIVPPDQYFPVYVQAETGCSWNKCTFCRLYRDRTYGVRSLEDFSKHLHSIKEFFGKGLAARRSVFMGDANAVNIDQKVLLQMLDMIQSEFNLPIFSFVDAISTQKKKSEIHFQEMREHGLKRVYIGLESGDPGILRIFNKLMNVSEAINLVNKIKGSGINVGIILMAGAGGKKFYRNHIDNTASVISQMDLGKGDIIYISPMYEYEDTEYYKVAQDLGILSQDEKMKQIDELKAKIREEFQEFNGKPLECPIAPYDIMEAVY
ncbi:radical SAM protein [Thermoplasma sp. Kam2015]|uniref:B12-binding domain-containing radical SAM protein n=1 Tax=Thermoplasma sp. Kam2015 TaxID=2094122 RepID=UPI000D85AEBC|nr:radical SAM protein [Thermoplasma sp. Kam2015]PYB68200.1 radical SAM protein [Thermoplasma sp. Kam2015]